MRQLDEMERSKALQLALYHACGSGVAGNIVEFGTMTGRSSVTISKALKEIEQYLDEPKRELHLFDTFSGFPKIDADIDLASPNVKSGVWEKGGCFEFLKMN